uniref:Uncharacterized protein n=1 Tax=Arundo donax TaxID=35708 RepID=A0A0A8ZPR8_ARUDO
MHQLLRSVLQSLFCKISKLIRCLS